MNIVLGSVGILIPNGHGGLRKFKHILGTEPYGVALVTGNKSINTILVRQIQKDLSTCPWSLFRMLHERKLINFLGSQ